MPQEPKNLSIIRERLRKSGSTLVFEMDKITEDILISVVKYLPEQKGTYKVRYINAETQIDDSESGLKIIVTDSMMTAEISSENRIDKLKMVGGDIYYSYTAGATSGLYKCDDAGLITQYKETVDKSYEFEIDKEKETKFVCHKFESLENAMANMYVAMGTLTRGFNIRDQKRINYTIPTGDTGVIMYVGTVIDYTNPTVINAILQVKPEDNYIYLISYTLSTLNMFRASLSEDNWPMISFRNNKIVFEEYFTKDYIYSKIMDKQCGIAWLTKANFDVGEYIIYTNKNKKVKVFVFNNMDKLCLIQSFGDSRYDVYIGEKITVMLESGDVDPDDIKVAFGKPMPEYKFEYL